MWPSLLLLSLTQLGGSEPNMIPKCSFDSTFYPQAQTGFNSALRPSDFSAFLPSAFIQYRETEDREQVHGHNFCLPTCSGSSYQSLYHQRMLSRELHLSFGGGTPGRVHRGKSCKCIETLPICTACKVFTFSYQPTFSNS